MNEEMQPKTPSSDKNNSSKEASIQVNMTNARARDILIGPNSRVTHEMSQQETFHLPDMFAGPPRIHTDILLITATDIETSAIIKQFPTYESLFIYPNAYYDFDMIAGARVCLVQTEQGAVSVGGSFQTVSDGINALSPSTVIMVGIAFGTDRASQNIGDILVAQQIMAYDGQKVSQASDGEMRIIPRGDRVTPSSWLLSRCHHGRADWSGADVHFGLILSGEKLIDHREFKDQLLALEPEAIGGEMEGVGLYLAAQRNKVDWIVVKAICDWADGNKRYRKHYYQQQAAENAAQFVFHIIQKGGFHR